MWGKDGEGCLPAVCTGNTFVLCPMPHHHFQAVSHVSSDTDTVFALPGKETEALPEFTLAIDCHTDSSVSRILHSTGHWCWATYKLCTHQKL